MYQQHFGLQEQPFALTPNTRFFLNLPSHQEALNLLLVALQGGDGFVKIVGEVGTGKTLLCRKLLNVLDQQAYITAYIPNPRLTPDELLQSFALELGIDISDKHSLELRNAINKQLVQHALQQQRVVLIVDETQVMPAETVEALRLLTNLETESIKLFQIVLFGQPELDELLNRVSLRQLKQRITFGYQLRTLNESETAEYLSQRMIVAGSSESSVFNRGAVKLLSKVSEGVPRRLNILAHKALMVAYGKGARRVAAPHVIRAVKDEGHRTPLLFTLTAGLSWPDLLVILAAMSLAGVLAWSVNA
ncbi:ExeA family protein [Marinobacterium jannaschii]|uniref:ExeA family protein n=1 Tax=Marinobacterium jannaschii TaxID=64970 RepID=UPI00048959C8|nr:AAA family ATPase [Marinobacterium jannaschii]